MYVSKYTAEVAFLRLHVQPVRCFLSETDVMDDGTPRVVWEFEDTTVLRGLVEEFQKDTALVSPRQFSRTYGMCNREMRDMRRGLR